MHYLSDAVHGMKGILWTRISPSLHVTRIYPDIERLNCECFQFSAINSRLRKSLGGHRHGGTWFVEVHRASQLMGWTTGTHRDDATFNWTMLGSGILSYKIKQLSPKGVILGKCKLLQSHVICVDLTPNRGRRVGSAVHRVGDPGKS